MNKDSISLLYPMAFYIFYICFILIGVFIYRIRAVRQRKCSPKYFKNYLDKSSLPPKLIILERHLDNQFQVPMLFLITCAVLIALNKNSEIHVTLAWLFIFTRMIHSYVHLTYNNIVHRVTIYALGLLIVVTQWILISV